MKKTLTLGFVGAVVLAFGAVQNVSGSAEVVKEPFGTLPAAGNIRSLSATPVFAVPRKVSRLSSDIRPANAQVHALGAAGHAWTRGDGNVCVLMVNGPGGCFSEFLGPVLLFLTGARIGDNAAGPQEVTGVVPNSVIDVVLITTAGESVATSIAGNGFGVEIPAGVGIAGEIITLADGAKFFNKDVVMPLPSR